MTSLSREDLHLEFARMCGLSYDLNPRNFEDRWHGFWNLVLGRMCRRLHCNAYGTAQESVWAHNTRHTPPRLADVEVWLDPDDSLTREEEHTGVGVPSQDEAFDPSSRGLQERIPDQESEGLDTGDLEGELDIVDVDTLDGMDATRTFDSRKVKVPDEKSTTQQQASSSSNVQPNVVQMASQELAKSKTGAGPSTTAFAQDWRIVPRAPHVPSGSAKTAVGGTRHRVPDSAINAYYSPDYTPQAMIAARKKRQEWTTNALVPAADVPSNGGCRLQESSAVQARQSRSDVASDNAAHAHSGSEQAPSQSISTNKPSTRTKKRTKQPVFQSVEEVQRELRKLPPTDPEDFDIPLNPISLLHGYKVYETKLVNTESKRLPSRQETEQTTMPWSHSFSVFMDEAQVDNIEQARVLFASPQWEHQNSILLFATSGDFYTHTIATRKPKGDQLVASDIAKPKKERPAFRVQPWSLPTWYGSDASNRREDKLVAWLNETFKHDEMEQQARDLRDKEQLNAQERQRTPPAEDNEQNDSVPNPAPPSPPSPPPPPPPPSPRLTRAMTRKLGDNGNEGSRGKDRTKGKGKGKARADPPPAADIEQDFNVATSALSPVIEADEDPGAYESSDSDEDAPPRKKARTELPPEGPSRSCSPSSAGGDTQSVASASVRPVPTRRSASASAQPAASTSTQPAASTSTRQSSELRRSTRAPHPVKFFNAPGKKDAKKNKLKRARTTPH
ncbi:uncharacterized protein SCHCODRAFT_02595011 [Schizophyllum commune H4-8]|uniref:Uncharacterized protein n=1 Tax=Schizophyllum commune (strain H4-8 / FGSC 9210) TaxID=578458 RepID=D8QLN4_SCHCM|nr:uncharacterized protein SCHCODRAFT_02595011 [Schizophyllum commune H4-8]KAI5884977.1 hypothetical protein SCHCODRAFT_02595011 [Schizophyllum commune H4-8]